MNNLNYWKLPDGSAHIGKREYRMVVFPRLRFALYLRGTAR